MMRVHWTGVVTMMMMLMTVVAAVVIVVVVYPLSEMNNWFIAYLWQHVV